MIQPTSNARPTTAVKAPAGAASAQAATAPKAQDALPGVQGTFKIHKRFFSFLRPTYDIECNGARVGTIQRKLFSFTPGWTLKDAGGQTIGSISQRFFSLGFDTDVRDEQGRKAGAIKQDILRSLVNPTAALRVLDGKGQVVAKTDPVWLTFHGRIDLKNANGEAIGQYANKWFSLTETNQLKLDQPMDKRLLLGFIASQIEVQKQEQAAQQRADQQNQQTSQASS